jgi:hypothetical protein
MLGEQIRSAPLPRAEKIEIEIEIEIEMRVGYSPIRLTPTE